MTSKSSIAVGYKGFIFWSVNGQRNFYRYGEILGDQCFAYTLSKNWITEFDLERTDVKVEHSSGTQISLTLLENFNSIRDMILQERQIGRNK